MDGQAFYNSRLEEKFSLIIKSSLKIERWGPSVWEVRSYREGGSVRPGVIKVRARVRNSVQYLVISLILEKCHPTTSNHSFRPESGQILYAS